MTSTLLYPMVSSPFVTLLGSSAACDLVNDDSSSLKPFLYLATRALCWLSSYFTPCSFSEQESLQVPHLWTSLP